jgi:hypothetical protein
MISKATIKLGYWTALGIAVAFSIYTAGYVTILAAYRIPQWTDTTSFAASINQPWFLLFTICQVMAFIVAPLYALLVNCLHEYARPEQKILARASSSFAIIFATLSSIHYFVQFGTIRQGMLAGNLQGLEQFIQLNPGSVIASINLLGWTLFLGISSWLIAPVFAGNGVQRVIKIALVCNGIFCLAGATGYLLQIPALILLFFNGMGLAMLATGYAGSIFFKRLEILRAG